MIPAENRVTLQKASLPRLAAPRTCSRNGRASAQRREDNSELLKIAICVIARNEADVIGLLVAQLAAQTLLAQQHSFQLVVVANGCTDATANVARDAMNKAFTGHTAQLLVHDTLAGGKARSWNLAVHELLEADSDFAIFLDADIELIDTRVLEELVAALTADAGLLAVSGHPVKDILKKTRKSFVDQFSLTVSQQSQARHSINGSLYAARMSELNKIWLPVPTPGEDGLLTAMIHTDGFSRPPNPAVIGQIARPTHYFEAHSVRSFFRHETRMTVGTVINGWICEYLWNKVTVKHGGILVQEQNDTDPQWVAKLVQSKVAGKWRVLPPRMLTWRLHNLRGIGIAKALWRAPFSLAATLLNLWPAFKANQLLKKQNAADYW